MKDVCLKMKAVWLKIENLCEKTPNWLKVILSACLSLMLIYFSPMNFFHSEIIKQEGFMTLFTLFVSSPVAFMIWSFRDRNATDQINNSRKDTNLKEYHKIVEWITDEDSSDELKISAIYSLRRFYEDQSLGFQESALYLLLSTWESMQKNELEKLKTVNDSKEAKSIIKSLRENGDSPLGIAITRVLLTDYGEKIQAKPQVFQDVCLAGMNFYLPGLANNIVGKIFKKDEEDKKDKTEYSGVQLQGCIFRDINLKNVKFNNSNLFGTEWVGRGDKNDKLNNVSFDKCDFRCSVFKNISLGKCEFLYSDFMNTRFHQVEIKDSAKFCGVNFLYSEMYFIGIPENESLLGSIIFETDYLKWSYKLYGNRKLVVNKFTLQGIKDLGIFILCEGNNKYNLCKFKINKINNTKCFEYSLENIRISGKDTISNNSNWNVSNV